MDRAPLSSVLPGTWELLSRVDHTSTGERLIEPTLGDDPVALLIYDRAGHFAAQFMRRDRTVHVEDIAATGHNNTRALGGYDAYFGVYSVNDVDGTVTQTLLGALSRENVGAVVTRGMDVTGDTLVIKVETTAPNGEAVTRTLTWRRVG